MGSLTTKILLGFTLPLLAICCLALLMRGTFMEVASTSEWVQHSDRAIIQAQSIDATALQALSAERGYLLRADNAFYEQYADARVRVHDGCAELARFVADNPEQAARIEQVSREFEQWDRDTATPLIAQRRTLPPNAPMADVERISPNLNVHRGLSDFVAAEQALLARRMKASDLALARSKTVLAIGGFLVAAAAIVAALVLARDIVVRLRGLARAADAVMQGRLGARSAAKGTDEIAHTSRLFDRMAERVQEREHERENLRMLSDLLQACATNDEVGQVFARLAGSIFPGLHGGLLVINASRNLLSEATRFGRADASAAGQDNFEPDDCWALRRGRPHVVLDSNKAVVCRHVSSADTRAFACHPLIAQGETVGVLHLAADTPSSDRLGLTVKSGVLDQVAEQLAMTSGNLRLRERLRNQSLRDPLTSLFNRRYLDDTLPRDLMRAARMKAKLGVILLDVDHFKRFNDTNGHEAGDLVLREFAAVLKAEFRASDYPCRYGGEEFIVVLPEAGLVDIARRAESLRAKIKAMRVELHGQTLGAISASMGIAEFPTHGDTLADLVRVADEALYRAKANGRDRVELGPLPT